MRRWSARGGFKTRQYSSSDFFGALVPNSKRHFRSDGGENGVWNFSVSRHDKFSGWLAVLVFPSFRPG